MASPDRHRPFDKQQLSARDELWVDYEGTPYLTALTQICGFVGVFVGSLMVILLLGNLQYGFGRYWWIALILVVDVVVNLAANVARARRRRALGLTQSQRLWRMGLGPRPANNSRR